jgi:hypothetical protein
MNMNTNEITSAESHATTATLSPAIASTSTTTHVPSSVGLSSVFLLFLFLCLSVSLEDTQHTETETFLYVRTGVLLNIPGARVLPGNLSARYTGIRANPIRAPGT